MSRLHRYVLRQFVVAYGVALGGLLFVLIPPVLVNAMNRVGSAGVAALLGYLPLVLAELVPYVLPLTFLLAVVSVFGRLVADREWTAVCMAGIHPGTLVVPVLFVAVLFGAGTIWFASSICPAMKYAQRNYKHAVLSQGIRLLNPGRTEIDLPGFFLTSARRDPDEPAVFYDAHVAIGDGTGPSPWVFADRVELSFLGNVLNVRLTAARAISGSTKLRSANTNLRFDLDRAFAPAELDNSHPNFMRSREMLRRIGGGEVDDRTAAGYTYEIHRRLALGATYLLFVLIGVPTAIAMRRGTQLAAFAVSIGYAVLYYVLSLQVAFQLYIAGVVAPSVAPWLFHLLGGALGGMFTLRALHR